MPESRRRRRRGQAIPRGVRSGGSLTESRPTRKKTNKLYLAASAVVAVLVIAGFAIGGIPPRWRRAPRESEIGRYGEYKEGIGVQQELMPTLNHVPEDTETVAYTAPVPPTSGDHWDFWARCGFYEGGLARRADCAQHGARQHHCQLQPAQPGRRGRNSGPSWKTWPWRRTGW